MMETAYGARPVRLPTAVGVGTRDAPVPSVAQEAQGGGCERDFKQDYCATQTCAQARGTSWLRKFTVTLR